jgi:hypothetical protein
MPVIIQNIDSLLKDLSDKQELPVHRGCYAIALRLIKCHPVRNLKKNI